MIELLANLQEDIDLLLYDREPNDIEKKTATDIAKALALLKEHEAEIEKLTRYINGFSRDAIPVVRCKDCKHRLLPEGETRAECMARAGWFPVDDDWFCADGERN